MSFISELRTFIGSVDPDSKLLNGLITCSNGVQLSAREIKPDVETNSDDDFAVQVWEDLWHTKNNIVKSRVEALLGKTERIHARQTIAEKIDQNVLNHFLEENHLNTTTKAKYKYGLFLKGELVAVASFGKSCPIQRDGITYKSHEMIRFCSKLGTTVNGGLSKLIKIFVINQKPEDIVTYADADWSNGKGYESLGFQLIGALPPQVIYVDSTTMERYAQGKVPASIHKDQLVKIKNSGSLKYLKKYK